jgi:hypothetical protein
VADRLDLKLGGARLQLAATDDQDVGTLAVIKPLCGAATRDANAARQFTVD